MDEVEKIIEELERIQLYIDGYYLESEENPVAEFVGSIGYGGELLHEVEDRLRSIKTESYRMAYQGDEVDTVCDFILRLIKTDKGTAIDFIQAHSKLERSDIYYNAWEICSMTIGEIEDQLEDQLVKRIEKLSKSDRALIDRQFCIKGSWIYQDFNYDRWVKILDHDGALAAIKEENLKRVKDVLEDRT